MRRPQTSPKNLRYITSTRGIIHMPEINTHAHGSLHLSESTADDDAFVWLRVSAANSLDRPLTDRTEVVLHVSLDDLRVLVAQCNFMIAHHPRSSVKKE